MVDNISYFTIRPPKDGAYRLTIYVKDTMPVSSNKSSPKDGVYDGVCEYQLIRESSPGNQVIIIIYYYPLLFLISICIINIHYYSLRLLNLSHPALILHGVWEKQHSNIH